MDATSLNALLLPLFRGVVGWLTNAYSDQKIDWPEWKKLIETVFTLGGPIVVAWVGASLADWGDTIVYATAAAVTLADMIRSIVQKKVAARK